MRNEILKKFESLTNDIEENYNKVSIIDSYDYSTYTILYLNKKESFDKFSDLWEKTQDDFNNDYFDDDSFDNKLSVFTERAEESFDFIELGTLDIMTDSVYELEI